MNRLLRDKDVNNYVWGVKGKVQEKWQEKM